MVPQAIPKPFTAAGQLVTGRCRYMGAVVVGTADDAASVKLWTGPATIGREIDRFDFTTTGTDRPNYFPQGILCEDGITVGAITGAIEGIIYYLPQTMVDGLVLIDESGSQRVIVDMHNQVDIDALWAALKEQVG